MASEAHLYCSHARIPGSQCLNVLFLLLEILLQSLFMHTLPLGDPPQLIVTQLGHHS